MAKLKNTYPDWAEKYRGKGKTIRKTKYGYGLYECTSEYVKGSHPKSKSVYLGMITEKDGFIPKKSSGDSSPLFIEYGLSHLIRLNFRQTVRRHTFDFSDDVFYLGILSFVFGDIDDVYIRSSYLTYADAERLCELNKKLSKKKIELIASRINDALQKAIPDAKERNMVRNLLMICTVESGPASSRKPDIPDEVRDILIRCGLKWKS